VYPSSIDTKEQVERGAFKPDQRKGEANS
jgi:hypothetical protein